jgi:hypothetical protein
MQRRQPTIRSGTKSFHTVALWDRIKRDVRPDLSFLFFSYHNTVKSVKVRTIFGCDAQNNP